MSDLTPISAEALDRALANISDVPTVEVDDKGVPTISFTGNYENPVNDLVEFMGALQRYDEDIAEAARMGLQWETSYGSADVTFNGLTVEGTSIYDENAEED